MLEKPGYWEKYYHGDAQQQHVLRTYSYSDRVRYYWTDDAIGAAAERLLDNLSAVRPGESVEPVFAGSVLGGQKRRARR